MMKYAFVLLISMAPLVAIHKNSLNRIVESDQVDRIFIERWSARAMSGQPIDNVQLWSLFEAARWAPSSYNEQPWRFLYAHRGSPEWNVFFDLLVPFNQSWCKNAAVLMVIISDTRSSQGGTNSCASFDTGAAWQNLALQGSMMGLVVHGMGGFNHQKAREVLNIPDHCTVEAMVAIGMPGSIDELPEYMQTMEKPSDRKPIKQMVAEGTYNFVQ